MKDKKKPTEDDGSEVTETAQQRARRKYRERKKSQGLVEVRVYVPEGMENKIEREARKLRDFAGIHLTKDLII